MVSEPHIFRLVEEGPVSRLIQEHLGAPCMHSWETAGWVGGMWLVTERALYTGRHRHEAVQRLEEAPRIEEFLRRKARESPEFMDQFTAAVQSGRRGPALVFLYDLLDEALAAGEVVPERTSANGSEQE